MKTLLTIYAIMIATYFLWVMLITWHAYKEDLRNWWQRHRPHWPAAKRRWAKRKHLRHVIAIAFRFNVLIVFAWLGGFGLTVFC